MSKTIGITLSGGGARGIAHLGVLQALQDMGIRPHALAGVSAGAIVGAMYANGYAPTEILQIIKRLRLTDFFMPSSFSLPGFFNIEKHRALFLRYLPHNSFEQLHIPLTVSATDVNAGETVFFNSGELITPLLASACVPIVFSPVRYQGRMLVDGGIISSMTIKPIAHCVVKIGVHVNPFDRNMPVKSTLGLLERCFTLSVHANARSNFAECDIIIEPLPLKNITPFDLRQAQQMYEWGYQAAMEHKEAIQAIVQS